MNRLNDFRPSGRAIAVAFTLLILATQARADSVAQIATAVRISRGTADLIDPQGRPGGGMGTDTTIQVGDILSFVAHFTPVPNGRSRGLGGYVTVYIPRNTEVVGARIIDSNGNTVSPHPGGLGPDGFGKRGDDSPYGDEMLPGGSISQLYADTGIFFSTDARTNRYPDGSVVGEEFLTPFNGYMLNPFPTAAGQLDDKVGADVDRTFAHNEWDVVQSYAFGVRSSPYAANGEGQTAHLYGSAVAGPQSWYPYEPDYSGPLAMGDLMAYTANGTVGPWQRIQTMGAEIGTAGNVTPMPVGVPTRVGIPAVGPNAGVLLNADNPLPSYNAMSPSDPYVRSLRFAVGELVVGEEYLSEFSLRVLATPLDPDAGKDIVCAEVFGGDASSWQIDPIDGGKDNTWRYFLPAPACVQMNLLFDLDVDKLTALSGDTLTYTLSSKNLSTDAHSGLFVRQCYESGDLTFTSATGDGMDMASDASCPDATHDRMVLWDIDDFAPGEEFSETIIFTAGNDDLVLSRAIFESTQAGSPVNFSTVAFTVLEEVATLHLDMQAAPDLVDVSAADAVVHYSATVTNFGNGSALSTGCDGGDACRFEVELPASWTPVAGSATFTGTMGTIADPTLVGSLWTFTGGLNDIAPDATVILEFDVTVPMGYADGAYSSNLSTWLADDGTGKTVSDARTQLAEVIVGQPRAETPTMDSPILVDATTVTGTSNEPMGSIVHVLVNGVEAGTGIVDGSGDWSVTVATLFSGQGVSSWVENPMKPDSLPTAEVKVITPEAAAPPQCSDGINNDSDGDIDFPDDTGCSSLLDDDESDNPQCSDGIDNDGDGITDFDNGDPGCVSAMDPIEAVLPECADGVDNEMPGDGLIDYPFDPGCTSAVDMSELDEVIVDPGPGSDGGVGADGGVGPGTNPSDLGGISEPGTGCGCVTAGRSENPAALWLSLFFVAAFVVRRRSRGTAR